MLAAEGQLLILALVVLVDLAAAAIAALVVLTDARMEPMALVVVVEGLEVLLEGLVVQEW
jgi:hypothetical protein